jgi:hypothetical protein
VAAGPGNGSAGAGPAPVTPPEPRHAGEDDLGRRL